MSYCRFSSDNWASDVYAYESDEGFVIHLATSRHEPLPPPVDWACDDVAELQRQYKAHHDALRGATLVALDHPLAGTTYIEGDLDDFEARLRAVKHSGLHVPESVFLVIAEERAAGHE